MKDPRQEYDLLLKERERLEKESMHQEKCSIRTDFWMRIFRGGMVLTSALIMYALVFWLLGQPAWAVLIAGVFLLLLFGCLERVFRRRTQIHRQKKADLREDYVRICDQLDELKKEKAEK